MKTILLVENHPHLAALYGEELREAGYYTLHASCGHEAAIQIALHRLDLMVLEPLVPSVDEVERALARWPELPIVINSSPDSCPIHCAWQNAAFVPKSGDLNPLKLNIEQVLFQPKASCSLKLTSYLAPTFSDEKIKTS